MFPNLLLKRARLTPERIALRYLGVEWTFQQIHTESIAFAERLHTIGILPGMRVAILASSNAQLVIAINGCMQLGCELVMLNERLTKYR